MARLAKIVAVVILIANPAMLRGVLAEDWLGQRVVRKEGAVLRAAKPTTDGGRPAPEEASATRPSPTTTK
jgi:hypothetical protein